MVSLSVLFIFHCFILHEKLYATADLYMHLTPLLQIRTTAKLSVYNVFLCMQGYIVKIVSSKHNQKNWQLQDEALSLMQRAGFIFSLAMRSFFAFGLVVRTAVTLAFLKALVTSANERILHLAASGNLLTSNK